MRDKYQQAMDIGFRSYMDGISIGYVPQYLNVNEKLAWIKGWKEAHRQQDRITMNYAQAIAMKDAETKQILYELFDELLGPKDDTISRVQECFKKAEELWRPRLSAAWGRTEADKLFASLHNEIPAPK